MTDIFTKERRSEIMASVRNRNTEPERHVRSEIFRAGFRFSLRRRNLPGSPDVVLPKYRIAVFVHGCFWHGHDCNRGKRPSSNVEFWNRKIDRNVRRDEDAAARLRATGWAVFVVWTCRVRKDTEELIERLVVERDRRQSDRIELDK